MYNYRREHDVAEQGLRKGLEVDPDFRAAKIWLGLNAEEQGHYEAARKWFLEAEDAWNPNLAKAPLGPICARMGKPAEARALLDELIARREQGDYVPATPIGATFVALGDKESALEWLDRAYADRTHDLYLLKVNPRFDPLRGDPRFIALLRRMGLS